MKEEDKKLLLKDLCARLPYGVKAQVKYPINANGEYIITTKEITSVNCGLDMVQAENIDIIVGYYIFEVKPYLFPLSSMTDYQEEELKNIYYSFNGMFQYTERIFDKIPFGKMKYFPYQIEEFFNKNHIDYRGLIPKGLAIDATNKNIY